MNNFSPREMSFLIVDDMDNMRRSIKAMLQLIQFGKRHYEAANGEEAWKLLNNEGTCVDFIIADWKMPKMNGIELLSKVRASKKLRDTPFLIITAEANQTIIAEAAENDVDAYLTKPFVTATLETKILSLLKSLEKPSPLATLLKKARSLRESGNIDGAIVCAQEAAKINNRSSRPLRELGILFLHKKDRETSLSYFQKAVKMNRMDVTSYHFLGQLHFAFGNIDKAIANYSMAMELSPRNPERAFKFASLLVEKERVSDAERIFRIVIKNNADNIELLEKVADTCLTLKMYGFAASTFKTVLRHDPERWYLRKKIGTALMKNGKAQDAIGIFEKAINSTPEDISLLISLAQCYLDINMPIRAEKWAIKVLRIDQENIEAKKILDQCP